MGWDITYHPLAAEEIAEVFFAGLDKPELVQVFAEKYGVPDFHVENLENTFAHARSAGADEPFAVNLGLGLAIVAGHLRNIGMCAAEHCLFWRKIPYSQNISAILQLLRLNRAKDCVLTTS